MVNWVNVKGIASTFKDRLFFLSSDIKNVLCGFGIITKNIVLHKYIFFASLFDLKPMEEFWNIMKRRCELLPNNIFSPLWYSIQRNKS